MKVVDLQRKLKMKSKLKNKMGMWAGECSIPVLPHDHFYFWTSHSCKSAARLVSDTSGQISFGQIKKFTPLVWGADPTL